jgi:hypothetical protein
MPFADVTANHVTYTTEGNRRLSNVGLETEVQDGSVNGTGTSDRAPMPLSLLAAKGAIGPNGLLSKTKTHLSSSPTPGNSPLVTPVANGGDAKLGNYFSERPTTQSSLGAEMDLNGDVVPLNGVSANGVLSSPARPGSSSLEGLGRVSRQLKAQINEFLETKFEDPSMQRVQKRVKESLDIMAEALRKYRCVSFLCPC